MSSSPELGADYGLKACLQLGAEQGLLKWVPRHHNGRCLFAMHSVRQLVAAAAAVPPASAGAVQGLLQELVQVADDCFVNLSDAESKGGAEGQKVTAWPLRVALAEAFMALFAHNHRLLPPDVLASVQEYMKGMLSDESYGARLAGSRLVQVRRVGAGGGGTRCCQESHSAVCIGMVGWCTDCWHVCVCGREPASSPFNQQLCRCCLRSTASPRLCLLS
jgi:hypothetical protein